MKPALPTYGSTITAAIRLARARTVGKPERGDTRARFDEETVGVAVIAAVELDDQVATRRRSRQPDGRHRGFGAAVHEPHHLERGHPLPHRLGELHLRFARRAVRPTPFGCPAYGLEHGGMGVAEDERTPRADVIDVRLAVDVGEATPGRARDEKGRSADRSKRPHRGIHPAGQDPFRPVEQLSRAGHVRATARKS
jgi:hypothetical protein